VGTSKTAYSFYGLFDVAVGLAHMAVPQLLIFTSLVSRGDWCRLLCGWMMLLMTTRESLVWFWCS